MTTIYDVARAAGVNASTVSYALSGKGTLSAATRQRVIRYARELGYRPNHVARSLIKRTTNTIGLIVPDIAHPFYAEVAQITDGLAHTRGLRVFVANTLHDNQVGRELLDDLADRQVDGVIVAPGGVLPEALRAARAAGLPVMSCFWEEAKVAVPQVVLVDFEAGGRIAAEHLLSLGHRRVGLVTQLEERANPDHHLRVVGFRDVMAMNGAPVEGNFIQMGGSSIDVGKDAGLRLLDLPHPPTAIFATNDFMAVGVLAAAWARGLRVPDDVSVIGFDDIVTAAYTVPPLTTVRIDKARVMACTIERLLAGDDVESEAPERVEPTLVIRHSTRRLET